MPTSSWPVKFVSTSQCASRYGWAASARSSVASSASSRSSASSQRMCVPVARVDAVVAGVGERAVPREVQHRRAERLGDLDRAVGRSRVDDDHLVDAGRARGEAVGEHLLLVLHDHAERDADLVGGRDGATGDVLQEAAHRVDGLALARRQRDGDRALQAHLRGLQVAGQVLEVRVEMLARPAAPSRRARPRSGRTARRRRSSAARARPAGGRATGGRARSAPRRGAPSGRRRRRRSRRSATRRSSSGCGRRRRRRPSARARRRWWPHAARRPGWRARRAGRRRRRARRRTGRRGAASASASRPWSQSRSGRVSLASEVARTIFSATTHPTFPTYGYHLRRIRRRP